PLPIHFAAPRVAKARAKATTAPLTAANTTSSPMLISPSSGSPVGGSCPVTAFHPAASSLFAAKPAAIAATVVTSFCTVIPDSSIVFRDHTIDQRVVQHRRRNDHGRRPLGRLRSSGAHLLVPVCTGCEHEQRPDREHPRMAGPGR